jgi:biopolymer transport protein ExbD
MDRKATETETPPYINVTPLIDVLLVLLIIFMVASPLQPKRFKAQVPEPPYPDRPPAPPWDLNIRVDLLENGRLRLNGEDTGSISDIGELTRQLKMVLSDREAHRTIDVRTGAIAKTVFVKAPRSMHYGEVAKVIDSVTSAGADPIGLQLDELDD